MPEKRPPRDRDTISEITITVTRSGSAFHTLATMLQERCLLNHLNRTLVHFELPDGRRLSFTVWPHDGDHAKYTQRVDNLNWSEH